MPAIQVKVKHGLFWIFNNVLISIFLQEKISKGNRKLLAGKILSNARNGYMPKVSRPRTEWGRSKTYYKAINDWATLPSALRKLMPKTIFK